LLNARPDGNLFGTVQALHALSFLPQPEARRIRERASAFILRRMQPPGIWGFWPPPFPADLDDTACAAACLQNRHPWLFFRRSLPLLLAHRDERGLFKTWFRTGPNDVDSVVNANIVWYLGANRHTAPVLAWVEDLFRQGREAGSFGENYEDWLALTYTVSRAVWSGVEAWRPLGGVMGGRIRLRHRQGGGLGAPLLTAMALCTLHNAGAGDLGLAAALAQELLEAQRPDGSWPAGPAWKGRPTRETPFTWWGSEVLTTAYCLEALGRIGAPA
jgi:hypothetical protein